MDLHDRETFLIEANVRSLRQAAELLERIDDRAYATVSTQLAPHRVGGHIRHIVEFYECFLEGVERCYVNYDARRRDESVERSRSVAISRIDALIQRLETGDVLRGDGTVRVRMEDAPAQCEDCYLVSSIGRELLVLNSHTVHHFALIAMTLKGFGIAVDRDFGVAAATLRYAAQRSATSSEAA
jgi:hypothetical protein